MTVADLIARLQQFPPDLRVLTDGYEGGLVDLSDEQVYVNDVWLDGNANTEWVGPHEEASPLDFPPDHPDSGLFGKPLTKCVVISRQALEERASPEATQTKG